MHSSARLKKLKPTQNEAPVYNGCGVQLQQKAKLKAEKHRMLRMDFSTFRQTMILIPTQIIRSARRLIFRLLAWSSSLETLFRLQDCLNLPLRT